MSWVTVVWAIIAAACLTLAAMHLPVWLGHRSNRASLAFSLSAIATAAFAACELSMLQAQTPDGYAAALRWLHVAAAGLIVSLGWFVYLYLGAGRAWLACIFVGLRALAVLLDFSMVGAPGLKGNHRNGGQGSRANCR
jgi:two-component system, LuxR family, sensor kinase FixL